MAVTAIPPARRTATIRISSATLATFLVSAITLAAFGPYVAGPLRTEQIAVYGLAAVVLPVTFFRFRPGIGLGIFLTWTMLVFVALVGVIFPYRGPQPWEPGNTLAGIDNFALPLVVMLLIWSTVSATDARRVLIAFARIVVWATTINGFVAVLSTRVSLDTYLHPFWSYADGPSVAERAASMGRLSGIFNQPAEAGVAYGVAGLLAVYLYVRRLLALVVALTGITLGGLICVSKVFMFGGLPLILASLVLAGGAVGIARLFVIGAAAGGVVQSGILSQWTGENPLLSRLAPTDDNADLISFYTSTRWGEDAALQTYIDQVLEISPITGMGAGGWRIPYDSAFTEAIVVAGLVGAVCTIAVLGWLGVIAMRAQERRYRLLMICFVILLAGASLGISPLTANRVATINWVLIAVMIRVVEGEIANRYRRSHGHHATVPPCPTTSHSVPFETTSTHPY